MYVQAIKGVKLKKEIERFAGEYYKALDTYASVETLLSFFNNNFCIVEGELVIDSIEKYKSWYENVNELFVTRLHTFKGSKVTKLKDHYEIEIDMQFEGLKKDNEKIQVEAIINWTLVDVNSTFKIKRYEVNIKG